MLAALTAVLLAATPTADPWVGAPPQPTTTVQLSPPERFPAETIPAPTYGDCITHDGDRWTTYLIVADGPSDGTTEVGFLPCEVPTQVEVVDTFEPPATQPGPTVTVAHSTDGTPQPTAVNTGDQLAPAVDPYVSGYELFGLFVIGMAGMFGFAWLASRRRDVDEWSPEGRDLWEIDDDGDDEATVTIRRDDQ